MVITNNNDVTQSNDHSIEDVTHDSEAANIALAAFEFRVIECKDISELAKLGLTGPQKAELKRMTEGLCPFGETYDFTILECVNMSEASLESNTAYTPPSTN
jgi:hypothetical protein